jgi:hypothetical protein
MYARTEDRDTSTTWATREAQYDAVCTWGIPDHALLQRLSCLKLPVFAANGDSDPMILPHYSYLLAEFAADVEAFLADRYQEGGSNGKSARYPRGGPWWP